MFQKKMESLYISIESPIQRESRRVWVTAQIGKRKSETNHAFLGDVMYLTRFFLRERCPPNKRIMSNQNSKRHSIKKDYDVQFGMI